MLVSERGMNGTGLTVAVTQSRLPAAHRPQAREIRAAPAVDLNMPLPASRCEIRSDKSVNLIRRDLRPSQPVSGTGPHNRPALFQSAQQALNSFIPLTGLAPVHPPVALCGFYHVSPFPIMVLSTNLVHNTILA